MEARNFMKRLVSTTHPFFATYIMEERRKEVSFFAKYLDTLPRTFDNFPIFYTPEELVWLDGSPMLEYII